MYCTGARLRALTGLCGKGGSCPEGLGLPGGQSPPPSRGPEHRTQNPQSTEPPPRTQNPEHRTQNTEGERAEGRCAPLSPPEHRTQNPENLWYTVSASTQSAAAAVHDAAAARGLFFPRIAASHLERERAEGCASASRQTPCLDACAAPQLGPRTERLPVSICLCMQELTSEAVAPLVSKLPLEARHRVGDFLRSMFQVQLWSFGERRGAAAAAQRSRNEVEGHVIHR